MKTVAGKNQQVVGSSPSAGSILNGDRFIFQRTVVGSGKVLRRKINLSYFLKVLDFTRFCVFVPLTGNRI